MPASSATSVKRSSVDGLPIPRPLQLATRVASATADAAALYRANPRPVMHCSFLRDRQASGHPLLRCGEPLPRDRDVGEAGAAILEHESNRTGGWRGVLE